MKKITFWIFALFIFASFFSCSSNIDKTQTKKEKLSRKYLKSFEKYIFETKNEQTLALKNYISNLSIEDKVCQLFIENLEGNTVFIPVEKKSDITNNPLDRMPLIPGGFLFFSYNIAETPEKIMRFTDSIREYCAENNIIFPFLALDQEGGWVTRLKNVAGPLPSNEKISQNIYIKTAYELYESQARQMRALGFNMNLAPVVEVLTEKNKDFLDGRSYGDAEDVILYGRTFINAMQNNGIGAVAKHFPGNTNTDPHTGFPEINLSYDELFEELQPFKNISKYNPSGILLSHARTSCFDKEIPATLSEKWITKTLINNFGFTKIIFSDDIFMTAFAQNGFSLEQSITMAIEAGVNCIMISEKRFAPCAKIVIEQCKNNQEFYEKVENSLKKILIFKLQNGLLKIQKNEKNEYEIINSNPFGSISERLVEFEKAKAKNIDICVENF